MAIVTNADQIMTRSFSPSALLRPCNMYETCNEALQSINLVATTHGGLSQPVMSLVIDDSVQVLVNLLR